MAAKPGDGTLSRGRVVEQVRLVEVPIAERGPTDASTRPTSADLALIEDVHRQEDEERARRLAERGVA